ncbi:TrbI/VirB10 family protein [Bartonella sp. A05]|uniref:TrbI/VirB10 family protein n=1 Tax=Bartonella sp. A05 TaxID=2967261 RepID=UPI0022A9BFED|nr:TrbI/VirB10 family protein [Bartonella sp. A05]MCZ2204478.1 type IV secretion system protein VirB10 [Bartonella sp. A05]
MRDNNIDEVISEDRGTINDGRNNNASKQQTKIIVGIAFAGFCGYILWSMLSTPPTSDDVVALPKPQQELQRFNVSPAPLELALPTPVDQIVLPSTSPTEDIDPLLDAARRAPVLAFTGKSGFQSNNAATKNFADNENSNKDTQGFSTRLKITQTENTKAELMGNRNFILAMGTFIPCILETPINSALPGFTSCTVNHDILSDNGRVVLLDKGTQIIGEYRSVINQGQTRFFILWIRAKTPNGVIVTLASSAIDDIGRASFNSAIDTHWWTRFKSALLISTIDDTSVYLTGEIDNNVQRKSVSNSKRTSAKFAPEHQINTLSTSRKYQGELINVFVARDLDFSSVYKLSVTETKTNVFRRVNSRNSSTQLPIQQK